MKIENDNLLVQFQKNVIGFQSITIETSHKAADEQWANTDGSQKAYIIMWILLCCRC